MMNWLKERLALLWWGEVCKKCGHRMGRHTLVEEPVTLVGEHVDRQLVARRWICPRRIG